MGEGSGMRYEDTIMENIEKRPEGFEKERLEAPKRECSIIAGNAGLLGYLYDDIYLY